MINHWASTIYREFLFAEKNKIFTNEIVLYFTEIIGCVLKYIYKEDERGIIFLLIINIITSILQSILKCFRGTNVVFCFRYESEFQECFFFPKNFMLHMSLVRDSSVVRRHYIFLLEPSDDRFF